jgi:hypothetical protein
MVKPSKALRFIQTCIKWLFAEVSEHIRQNLYGLEDVRASRRTLCATSRTCHRQSNRVANMIGQASIATVLEWSLVRSQTHGPSLAVSHCIKRPQLAAKELVGATALLHG